METALDPSTDTLSTDMKEEHDKLFDFATARIHLKRLISDWGQEITDTEKRRETRDVHVNVEELRRRGHLDEDETLVPVRVIDTNIQRELPPYINYLKNSRRLCLFSCLENPLVDTQRLEIEYTRGMTYLGWEIPHYKNLDGSMTHGWDAVEVVFDETKPLHVAIEHIGHDKLFFPRSNRDIQQAPRIIRAYDVTLLQLKNFVTRFGFDAAQVDLIVQARKDGHKENETLCIYKEFCKYNGVVYVSWFAIGEESNFTSDWLKAPMPYTMGISEQIQEMETVMLTQVDPLTGLPAQVPTQQPKMVWKEKPLVQYPVFILPYRETEKLRLIDHKGRVFLDESKQEAQTAILSSFIVGNMRASQVFAAQGQEDGTGVSLKEIENLKLTGNRVLNKPIQFFHMEYPDPSLISFMQYMDVANSQETNQVNFAATNREDSRKTAEEIRTANQQAQLLNSVQLALFSTHLRAIYSFAWQVVRSQALQGLIAFMRVPKQKPVINPLTGQPIFDAQGQPATETYHENDTDILKYTYDVRAAGDVDVVQRQEKIQQMMQDWPVISNTPLAGRFLQDLMRLKYPDQGEDYANVLAQSDQIMQTKTIAARLGMMMDGAIKQHPEMLQALSPEQQQILQQTLQAAAQIQQGLQQQPTKKQ